MKRSKREKKSSIYAIVERRPPSSVTRSPAARVAHCPTHSGSTQSFSPVGHSAVFAGKEKPSCRKRGRERMPKTNNKKGCQGKRRTARLPSSSPLPWKSVPFFFFVFSRRSKGGGVHAFCHRPLLLPSATAVVVCQMPEGDDNSSAPLFRWWWWRASVIILKRTWRLRCNSWLRWRPVLVSCGS